MAINATTYNVIAYRLAGSAYMSEGFQGTTAIFGEGRTNISAATWNRNATFSEHNLGNIFGDEQSGGAGFNYVFSRSGTVPQGSNAGSYLAFNYNLPFAQNGTRAVIAYSTNIALFSLYATIQVDWTIGIGSQPCWGIVATASGIHALPASLAREFTAYRTNRWRPGTVGALGTNYGFWQFSHVILNDQFQAGATIYGTLISQSIALGGRIATLVFRGTNLNSAALNPRDIDIYGICESYPLTSGGTEVRYGTGVVGRVRQFELDPVSWNYDDVFEHIIDPGFGAGWFAISPNDTWESTFFMPVISTYAESV